MIKTKYSREELQRIDTERFESAMDGFFGRTRKCKYCHTPTLFDPKIGRYCPNGCFRGNDGPNRSNRVK